MGGGLGWPCVNGACRSPVGMRVDCELGGAHSDTWAVLNEGVCLRSGGCYVRVCCPCNSVGSWVGVCVWRAKR